jgi:inosine triphosphate pyrophosphatase
MRSLARRLVALPFSTRARDTRATTTKRSTRVRARDRSPRRDDDDAPRDATTDALFLLHSQRTLESRAMATTITFVTGNAKKLEEVRAIVGADASFSLTSKKIDLPELQGEPEDVAREKARLAAAALDGPALVEDTSLCFNALNGLPGPYVKWFLEKTGHEGLNNILAAYEDKSAYAQCVFAYASGPDDAKPMVFVGKTPGRIVPARGPTDFGWDPVFEPDGFDVTYAEMDKETKNSISHRFRALEAFRAYMSERDA